MSSSSPKENNFQIHFTQVSRWSHPRIYISLQCGCKWCKTCLVIPYNNSCEQNDDTIYGQLMWMRECSYHNIKGKQSRQKKELNQTYWPVWKTISTMSLSMENRNHSYFFLKGKQKFAQYEIPERYHHVYVGCNFPKIYHCISESLKWDSVMPNLFWQVNKLHIQNI